MRNNWKKKLSLFPKINWGTIFLGQFAVSMSEKWKQGSFLSPNTNDHRWCCQRDYLQLILKYWSQLFQLYGVKGTRKGHGDIPNSSRVRLLAKLSSASWPSMASLLNTVPSIRLSSIKCNPLRTPHLLSPISLSPSSMWLRPSHFLKLQFRFLVPLVLGFCCSDKECVFYCLRETVCGEGHGDWEWR